MRVSMATGRCFSHKVLCAMGERTNDTEPAVLTAFNVRDSESFNVLRSLRIRSLQYRVPSVELHRGQTGTVDIMMKEEDARHGRSWVRRPATLKCLRAVCRIMATDLRFCQLLPPHRTTVSNGTTRNKTG